MRRRNPSLATLALYINPRRCLHPRPCHLDTSHLPQAVDKKKKREKSTRPGGLLGPHTGSRQTRTTATQAPGGLSQRGIKPGLPRHSSNRGNAESSGLQWEQSGGFWHLFVEQRWPCLVCPGLLHRADLVLLHMSHSGKLRMDHSKGQDVSVSEIKHTTRPCVTARECNRPGIQLSHNPWHLSRSSSVIADDQ